MSFPDFRTRRLGLTTAAAAIAFAVAGTAAAQSMVVRSTGPSASKYPTGAKLKASDKLTLVAGDKIVLMQGGKTRTLSGPGTYRLTYIVSPPTSRGMLRHTDKASGVPDWWKPITASWTFNYPSEK